SISCFKIVSYVTIYVFCEFNNCNGQKNIHNKNIFLINLLFLIKISKMSIQIYNLFLKTRTIAILIDPDKTDKELLDKYIYAGNNDCCDLYLIGGSLIFDIEWFRNIIITLKSKTSLPVIIFPGNYTQIISDADGILFLQLFSGRNPEYLISQQIIAAPIIYKSGLPAISTAYILIDGGNISST